MIRRLFSAQGADPIDPPIGLSAFISPNDYYENAPNGAYTTPYFYGTAAGVTEPYAYQWTSTDGAVITPTATKTRLQMSGSNREVNAELTLTVTDSLGRVATSQRVAILIQFGTPQ